MAKAIVKKTVADAIAAKCDTTKVLANKVVDGLCDLVEEKLVAGEEVFLDGLGKLTLVEKDARIARNPATGDPVDVPAKRIVKFKASRTLKAQLNG